MHVPTLSYVSLNMLIIFLFLLQMSRAVPASDYVHMVVEEILLKPEIADLTRPLTKCRYALRMIRLDEPTTLEELLQRSNSQLVVPQDNKVVLPGNNDTSLRYFSHLVNTYPYTREDHIVRTDDIPIGVINVSIYRLYHVAVPFFEEVDRTRVVTYAYELFIGTYPDVSNDNLVYLQTSLPQQNSESSDNDDMVSLFANEDEMLELDGDVQWAEPTIGDRVVLDITGITPQGAAGQIEHYGIHRHMTGLDYMPYGDRQPIARRRRISDLTMSDTDDDEPP